MKCPDIIRIANTGSFAHLTDSERQAAAAHARTCRHCAPVWGVHAQLAATRIPRTPPELALRCRTAAATGSQRARVPMRRLILISGVLAVAAAAGALMWHWPPVARVTGLMVEPPSDTSPSAPAMIPSDPEHESEQIRSAALELPLVPEPAAKMQDPEKVNLAMQKAVDRHPELVQGQLLDDPSIFIVAIALRTDGSVLDSAAELASPDTSTEINERLARILPTGAGEHIASGFDRGQQLPDGSVLRARVFLSAVLIADSFDVARSDVRVREILGHHYDDLMTPSTSEEFSMLTVFLSDDGRILREKAERITMRNAAVVMGLGTGMGEEEALAAKLGIAVEQIGLIGRTTLSQGAPRGVVDQNGIRRIEGMRLLGVRYAWARRPEEPAAIHAPRRTEEPQADFDLAAALVVAERLLPDAFSTAPPSLADMQVRPTVVFTAKGEVLRAGRVRIRNGVELDSLLQEQLVPGVSTRLHRSARLTNKAGATALVEFAWAE